LLVCEYSFLVICVSFSGFFSVFGFCVLFERYWFGFGVYKRFSFVVGHGVLVVAVGIVHCLIDMCICEIAMSCVDAVLVLGNVY